MSNFDCIINNGNPQRPGSTCPHPACAACTCHLDVNQDGWVDAADIRGFVACVVTGTGGANCACGDLDGNGTTDVADIAPFVAALLGGPTCP